MAREKLAFLEMWLRVIW